MVQIPTFTAPLAIPADPGPPRADPSAYGAAGAAMAEAGRQVTGVMDEFNQRYQDARRQSDAANLAAQADRQLGDLQFALSTKPPVDPASVQIKDGQPVPNTGIPDHKAAYQAFQEQAAALRAQTMAGINDPQVQAYVAQHFDQMAISRGLETKRAAFALEASGRRGVLDGNLDQFARDVATAPNPTMAAQAFDSGKANIDGAVASGWLDPQAGADRLLRFKSDAAEVAVRQDMNADPDAAVQRLSDPKQYPGLLPDRREILAHTAEVRADLAERRRLSEEMKAMAQAERDLRRFQAGNEARIFADAAQGVPVDVNKIADMVRTQQITPSGANAALSAQAGHDDPLSAARLWAHVGDGTAKTDDVYGAMTARKVSGSTGVEMIKALAAKADRGDDQVERGVWGMVNTALGGDAVDKGLVNLVNSEGIKQVLSLAQARGEWARRVTTNGEDPWMVGPDIINRYQPPSHPPVTWDRPRLGGVFSAADVAAVAAKTEQAYQSGQLSEGDYQGQKALLLQYGRFFSDLDARGAAARAVTQPGQAVKSKGAQLKSVTEGGNP